MFTWPVEGSVSRGFDYKSSIYVGGMHAAIDIPAAIGVPFRAVADGVVASVGWDIYSGHFVAVDHYGGWRSIYRHGGVSAPVVQGQQVGQGQVVRYSGNTGYTLGPHIHFDLWSRQKQDPTAFYKNGWWAHDPELYLGKEEDMVLTTEDKEWIKAKFEGAIRRVQEMHDVTRAGSQPGGGSGLTFEETVEANREAARKGTD